MTTVIITQSHMHILCCNYGDDHADEHHDDDDDDDDDADDDDDDDYDDDDESRIPLPESPCFVGFIYPLVISGKHTKKTSKHYRQLPCFMGKLIVSMAKFKFANC